MPVKTPPLDMSAIGEMVGKLAGDARKNMDKWWAPQSMVAPIQNAANDDDGMVKYLYTNLAMYALKKNKEIFRKRSSYIDEHLEFNSESEKLSFLKGLKGKTFFTRFNSDNSKSCTIIIMEHGFVFLEFRAPTDEGKHILEYDAISFDPKFITAHFNKILI